MKTLLSKLVVCSIAFFAVVLNAEIVNGGFETGGYRGDILFRTGGTSIPVCYAYAFDGAATYAEEHERLVKNEVFRALVVRDSRAAAEIDHSTTPSVSIDAAGQIVLGENAIDAMWLKILHTIDNETVVSDYVVVGDEAGVPDCYLYSTSTRNYYGFTVFAPENALQGTGYDYLYLVAMDTRSGEGICEGKPYHVKSYAMALCKGDASTSSISYETPLRSWAVGWNSSTSIVVGQPGRYIAWQPVSAIESLVVTQDGAQVTLTGDELAAYLKPSVNSLTQGIEDGEPVLNLAVTAPDVQYYTLYTKAKLSDTEWTKFEDYLKTLDNADGKYYTRFRIDGESPLKIPVLTDETSRFYQLRGE